MPITFMQIQVLKGTKDAVGDLSGLAGAYSSVFYGVDGQEYRISGNEIKTVPSYVGTPWLAADTNLEQVGKSH